MPKHNFFQLIFYEFTYKLHCKFVNRPVLSFRHINLKDNNIMKKTSHQIFNFKRISSFKSTLAIAGLVVMAGCNGGGATNTEIAGLESDLMTGQFIDGPVRGVKYECSSGRFGVTNSQGHYTCKKNDTVSFKVDNVTLGTANAEAILTPVSLSPEDTEVAVNIAQLLQTLDDDGDLSSFVIDDEKAALLDESLDVTSASFDADAGTMLSTPLVDEGAAIAHLNESITTLTDMKPVSLTAAPIIEPVSIATPLSTPIDETVAPAAGATNSYLETFAVPSCDASNPEVQMITKSSDWSLVNSSSKRIFCVSPGDYTSLGQIKLTADGTEKSPRYIILNDGKKTHPAKLSASGQANVHLKFDGASHWIIHRMSTLNITAKVHAMTFNNASTNNIIDQHHMDNCYQGIFIFENSHENVIQNSRIENETDAGRRHDGVGIALNRANTSLPALHIKNTKIINNEIYNYSDGVQLVRSTISGTSTWRPTNFEGTVIDSNDIYIDSKIYTDGTGRYTPSGNFAYAENAIDLKAGSDYASNPITITNNHMWGYRKSDRTNATISDHGNILGAHYVVKNINITNNYLFDAPRGMQTGTMTNATIKNNVIHKCTDWYMYFQKSSDMLVANNIFVADSSSKKNWAVFSGSDLDRLTLTGNVAVNTAADSGSLNSTNTVSKNFYYNVPTLAEDKAPQVFSSATQAQHGNYTFTTDNFTNAPKSITLKGVVPTASSPHVQR